MSLEAYLEVKTLQLFGEAMITYNLIVTPISGDNGSEDIVLEEDGELLKGPPALMWGSKTEGITSIIVFYDLLIYFSFCGCNPTCHQLSVGPNPCYAFFSSIL